MAHPGIVSGVTAFFEERGANILELSTDTEPARHTGTTVFSLVMEIEVPAGESGDGLEEAFAASASGRVWTGR
jgi:glycine cleavage system regulatory protein